jgi:hypothetical protein
MSAWIWDHRAMTEFRIGDPGEVHDVLAAEEFALPATDPALHHGPVELPSDPLGTAEPHDVLAAEEFAMPAVRHGLDGSVVAERSSASRAGAPVLAAFGALVFLIVLRRLRRR